MTDTHARESPHRYDPYPGLVALGTRVEAELMDQAGRGERLAFDIVPDRAADFAAGFLGAGTPLAQAIMGRPAGTVVSYEVGDMNEVRILSVARSQRVADEDAAATRQAAVQEAVERSNLEEMVRLALTVDVKWGDYDPEGIAPDKEVP